MNKKYDWNITSGALNVPLKGVIYGENGIGKTTFCSHAENPIIFDLEGNTTLIETVKTRQNIEDFEQLEFFLDELIKNDIRRFGKPIKTIVIDSLDKLEIFATEHIKKTYENNPKALDYGRGSAYVLGLFESILSKLDRLHSEKNMNILLIAHNEVDKEPDPRFPSYDKHVLRLAKGPRKLIGDWAYFVLFAAKDIFFQAPEDMGFGKKKVKAHEKSYRRLYTTESAIYYAKNGYNLPPQISLEWEEFMNGVKAFHDSKPSNEETPALLEFQPKLEYQPDQETGKE